MAYEKRVKPFSQHMFTSSAERVEHEFLPSDLGDQVFDLETGSIFIVKGGGAGEQTMLALGDAVRELTVGRFYTPAGVLLDGTTAPSFDGQLVTWAPGIIDPAKIRLGLPSGMDDMTALEIPLDVFSGATDPASFTILASFDGAPSITIEADDTATVSGTRHRITATINAEDVPEDALILTLVLTPAAHATDPINLAAQAAPVVLAVDACP